MKTRNSIALFIAMLVTSTLALANNTYSEVPVAVHIKETHYYHQTKLNHAYYEHWHTKGPMVESLGLAQLKQSFPNTGVCNAEKQATLVLSLEPHIFFNTQVRTFYSKMIVKGYTQPKIPGLLQDPFVTIEGEAKQIGSLMNNPEASIAKAYEKAIDDAIVQLKSDPAFNNALEADKQHAETICSSLEMYPNSRFYY